LSGEIQRSVNSATWVKQTQAGAFAGTFRDAIWCNALGLFVAVGDDGEIQTSPTGVTWTARLNPAQGLAGADADIFKVVCTTASVSADAELLAVTRSGAMIKSSDAITWTLVATPPSIGTVNALLWVDGVWHAFGANAQMAVSMDRETWSTLEMGRRNDTTITIAAAVVPPASSPRWFAVGGTIDSFFFSLGI
jgi:hypothetical protein